MQKFISFFSLLYFLIQGSILNAEIIIDGKLDEVEWNQAKQITTFYEVFPYTPVSYTHLTLPTTPYV